MNRDALERELKHANVSLDGWLPVLQCNICKQRWEPFVAETGASASTARFDYWMCPNKCNANAQVGIEVKTAIPRYVVINEIPGMIFARIYRSSNVTCIRWTPLRSITARFERNFSATAQSGAESADCADSKDSGNVRRITS